jgi:ketosteroid isomerase-like protein
VIRPGGAGVESARRAIDQFTEETMSDNAQLVAQAYEAFGRGDIPALMELLSDDVRWESSEVLPQGGSYDGHDGVGEFFAGVAREWPELGIEIEATIADGEHVATVGRGDGRLADGREAGFGFSHVFTLADGKVTRFREYAAPDASLR